MINHQKRNSVPKNWSVVRKGTKFVVNSMNGKGVPVLVALRDMLKVAKTRKEVKRALHRKDVLLNGKALTEDKTGVVLFDILTLVPSKMNYVMELSDKGKFNLVEIKESETKDKVAKIDDKKVLKGKKVQLNLEDGRNVLSDIECNVNDSVIFNFKDKKITKCLPLKEKANALVTAGKHAGMKGVITKLRLEEKMVEMEIGKNKVNVLIKQMMVTK